MRGDRLRCRGLAGCGGVVALFLLGANLRAQDSNETARLPDRQAPLAMQGFPDRPPPLIEFGDKFLGTGNLQKGITLPTGEVISPNFWVFGTLRSAVQTFDTGNEPNSRTTEWANRLDVFGNLQFTPTERLLAGWRPFDERSSSGKDEFSGYRFEPLDQRGFVKGFGATPTALFFEGEPGEMFPRLDDHDRKNLDYGFAVGRQPLLLQDGLLANSFEVDMLSVTRNSMLIRGGSTLRLSGLVAAGQIERPDYSTPSVANVKDPSATLFGLDGAADFPANTVEGDLLYETSGDGGNAFYAGLGSIQRFGMINSTVRAVTSVALDGSGAKVSTGTLLLSQMSYTPHGSDNLIYLDGYWGIHQFSSAVRDPTAGGPLGDVGILTAAVGLGSYGAPLGNQADSSVGGALGYQMFFGELHRRQLIFELGGRAPTRSPELLRQQPAGGLGARFQQAFRRRFVLVVDAFCVLRDESGTSFGSRVELETKF